MQPTRPLVLSANRAPSTLVEHRFGDLDTVIDRVHELFDDWEAGALFHPTLDAESLEWMRLAVHEWIANLVQHADFGGRTPELCFAIAPHPRRIHCIIEDNSEGFNLERQLYVQKQMQETGTHPPERGMGLLMLQACTEELSYRRLPDNRQRLEFYISSTQDPCLNIPF